MEIVNLGPDEIYEYSLKSLPNYSKIIYRYVIGDWDGDGALVGFLENGNLASYNLTHCSCYGPLDNGPDEEISVQDYISKYLNSTGCEYDKSIAEYLVKEV